MINDWNHTQTTQIRGICFKTEPEDLRFSSASLPQMPALPAHFSSNGPRGATLHPSACVPGSLVVKKSIKNLGTLASKSEVKLGDPQICYIDLGSLSKPLPKERLSLRAEYSKVLAILASVISMTQDPIVTEVKLLVAGKRATKSSQARRISSLLRFVVCPFR